MHWKVDIGLGAIDPQFLNHRGGFPAELVGLFASIGIKKGQPFQPDERMQEILTDAAVANATARALSYRPRKKGVYFCPDRQWYTSFSGAVTNLWIRARGFSITGRCFTTWRPASRRRWWRRR